MAEQLGVVGIEMVGVEVEVGDRHAWVWKDWGTYVLLDEGLHSYAGSLWSCLC